MSLREWTVDRVIAGEIVRVGAIARDEHGTASFRYAPAYLEERQAMELSCSLPLRSAAFPEAAMRPYFEGLLPEGEPRRAIAERNGMNEEDYLALLGLVGRDCIGDVLICEGDVDHERDPSAKHEEASLGLANASYRPMSLTEIDATLKHLSSVAEASLRSRLSLAGSQRKIGLAHAPGESMDVGWFQPLDCAASTHVLKVGATPRYAALELLCMAAAPALGIEAAKTTGLALSQPVVVSERFDRLVVASEPSEAAGEPIAPPVVYRLHQEDLNQAFGFLPGSKYAEVEGGSYRAIARLLRERSISVSEDLGQLARLAVYDFLVGNCDNHLKNLSILHTGPRGIKLAPVYDILCTTIFEVAPGVPRWSRRMGMRLGNATEIDDVKAEDFALLARDLGIGRRAMIRLCREIGEGAIDAIIEAGERLAFVSEAIPFEAEDLLADMSPRLAVLRAVR